MIKRNILIGIAVIFVIISGVCYSCKYNSSKAVLLSGRESNIDNNISTEQSAGSSAINDKMTATILANGLSEEDDKAENINEQTDLIAVHICGAVKLPGVYEVKDCSRLYELIELAGGLTEEAAGDYINQAERVTDGRRYYIPTVKELEDLPALERYQGEEKAKVNVKDQLVNINTADEDELMTLPGIGEAKAKSIIDYREANGIFKTTDELMNIPGIKEGLYSKISSRITVK